MIEEDNHDEKDPGSVDERTLAIVQHLPEEEVMEKDLKKYHRRWR